jgi:hypothetical protein
MLTDLAKLTKDEFEVFFASGAFTGFTEQDMAQAEETDRGKMKVFNEALRLSAYAKRLVERRRNLGQ